MVIVTQKTPVLDLHGEQGEIARVLVDEFIKDNYKMHNDVVIIMHGKGTKTLLNVTHETLKKSRIVSNFYLDNWNTGRTIVVLKN